MRVRFRVRVSESMIANLGESQSEGQSESLGESQLSESLSECMIANLGESQIQN